MSNGNPMPEHFVEEYLFDDLLFDIKTFFKPYKGLRIEEDIDSIKISYKATKEGGDAALLGAVSMYSDTAKNNEVSRVVLLEVTLDYAKVMGDIIIDDVRNYIKNHSNFEMISTMVIELERKEEVSMTICGEDTILVEGLYSHKGDTVRTVLINRDTAYLILGNKVGEFKDKHGAKSKSKSKDKGSIHSTTTIRRDIRTAKDAENALIHAANNLIKFQPNTGEWKCITSIKYPEFCEFKNIEGYTIHAHRHILDNNSERRQWIKTWTSKECLIKNRFGITMDDPSKVKYAVVLLAEY